ncbi:glycoside hydrolase family 89 protein [Trichoderma harzianum CBS 226.95]|uniref:Glycoside hydrolase family 89 protein n=1 Tax=Trichoderma harzianum CBS 226.95 TaxID=983964 RepID=A0A2T4A2Z5_TRIHA|nr:glycoside hydrolase family 89 protein [Trichoderma harzianum CBS 226.95]PTB51442.1 glycoside hydrolase family 89 protein [Trichoderma harzianum CBS 226.95]
MHLFNVITAVGLLSPLVGAINASKPTASTTGQTAGIQALVKRRIPQHENSFIFSLTNDTASAVDNYTVVSTVDGKIHVQGTSLSSIVYGLNSYLSDVVHVDIWWHAGSQLQDAPASLPKLSSPLNGQSIVPYRYELNTGAYENGNRLQSSKFQQKKELQLDWMALRGINIAPAWIGIEKFFIEVFREVGFTDDDILDFFTGPAFLAWNHFGNLQGSWSSNLPFEWVDNQFALQKKIVKRMVELAITPILPAFPGFVPRAVSSVLPDAQVLHSIQWVNFPEEYTEDILLDPVDPLFAQMQLSFITKQQQAYGNITNFYTLDQFNEMTPPSEDLDYLRNASSNTWKALKAADPNAIWVFQAWLFAQNTTFWTNDRIEGYLGGVTTDSDMLILDIWSESIPQWQRAQSYYGKPWIWCELQIYGATINMYGQIQNVTKSPILALQESKSLVGFGLSMEGQQGNEIVYDLLLSQAWSSDSIDTKAYFKSWAAARYSSSKRPASIYAAWETVRTTVYDNTNLTLMPSVPKSIIELIPRTTDMANIIGILGTKLTYEPATMAGLQDTSLFNNSAYQYDIVDWTRQVLANAFIPIYEKILQIYNMPNQTAESRATQLRTQGEQLTRLLLSLDLVLSSNKNFRLSTWLSEARASAPSPAYADFFEYKARNQITVWGPSGQLIDYASKGWSGLMKTYHLKRWQMFIDYLVATEPANYNQTEFQDVLLPWELSWANSTGSQPDASDEDLDVEDIIRKMAKQWSEIFA